VRRALELMFSGESVTGADAVAIGLANRVVPATRAERSHMELARTLARAAAGPPRDQMRGHAALAMIDRARRREGSRACSVCSPARLHGSVASFPGNESRKSSK
jgi:enoyl-CoA hydratase/carnithine racemase